MLVTFRTGQTARFDVNERVETVNAGVTVTIVVVTSHFRIRGLWFNSSLNVLQNKRANRRLVPLGVVHMLLI
jgi:hypothetical protein